MSSDREDEGILWVWNFRIQDFWGLENWWPDLSVGFFILLFFGGEGGSKRNNLEYLRAFNFYCLPFVVIYRILWLLRLGNSAWDFLGANFCCRDFWGVLIFASIRSNLEVPSPLGPINSHFIAPKSCCRMSVAWRHDTQKGCYLVQRPLSNPSRLPVTRTFKGNRKLKSWFQ